MMTETQLTWHSNKAGNLNVFIDDDAYQISNKHPSRAKLIAALEAQDVEEFKRLFHEFEMRFLGSETYDIAEKVCVEREKIEYRGQLIDDCKLVQIIKNYNTSCDALKRFIDNMFLNPNWESVKQLGEFLAYGEFPLTEDGCFLGYKAVRQDFLDIYSGTMDNSIGNTVTMPRKDVTFDPKLACSAGLHVGTYGYVSGYGGDGSRIIVVKVNPAHCVSVPHDHSAQKLRCSQYTVVGECDSVLPVSIVYDMNGRQFDTENYFADIKTQEEYRRRRPAPTDTYDDDYDDDDDYGTAYYCDNCDWQEDRETIDESVGSIAWCPKCGSAIEIIEV